MAEALGLSVTTSFSSAVFREAKPNNDDGIKRSKTSRRHGIDQMTAAARPLSTHQRPSQDFSLPPLLCNGGDMHAHRTAQTTGHATCETKRYRETERATKLSPAGCEAR